MQSVRYAFPTLEYLMEKEQRENDDKYLDRGAFHSFEKRTRFFLNKRILTDFSWIFLKNKRIFAKGVRDFWE